MANIPLKVPIVRTAKNSIVPETIEVYMDYEYDDGAHDSVQFHIQDYKLATATQKLKILDGIKEILKIKNVI